MRRIGAAAVLALGAALSASVFPVARAQQALQLTPPAPREAAPPGSGAAKRPPASRPRSANEAQAKGKQQPSPPKAVPAQNAAPPVADKDPDDAFGAYQRGHYLTAFAIATRRVDSLGDPKSMTLLGELYANGFGVSQSDEKAAEWYRLSAERGDREAMFALAMFRLGGRAGPVDREASAKLLASAAKLGHVAALYDLGLLYLEGQLFPQDFARAAELFRSAADSGSPEAQYALATLYKEGRGVRKDLTEAVRWLGAAAAADYTDAQVEFAIALFNGNGVAKDETGAAAMMRRAARKGSPIAQDRLAKMLAYGRGVPADPVEAIKWHLVSKAGGASDLELDDFTNRQSPDIRAAAQKAAKPFLDSIKASNS